MTMLAGTEGFLGTLWFCALVFIAGALIGAPLWKMMRDRMGF